MANRAWFVGGVGGQLGVAVVRRPRVPPRQQAVKGRRPLHMLGITEVVVVFSIAEVNIFHGSTIDPGC